MPSALSLSSILCDVSLEFHSDPSILVRFGSLATVFVWFTNFRCRRKGVLLWGLLLSHTVRRLAIIIPISYPYQEIKMKSAKPEPVPTTSFEYFQSYSVAFVSIYTFNLRNRAFSRYANLTLPEFGNFGYSWDHQTTFLFLASLNVFQVLCKIKPLCSTMESF